MLRTLFISAENMLEGERGIRALKHPGPELALKHPGTEICGDQCAARTCAILNGQGQLYLYNINNQSCTKVLCNIK